MTPTETLLRASIADVEGRKRKWRCYACAGQGTVVDDTTIWATCHVCGGSGLRESAEPDSKPDAEQDTLIGACRDAALALGEGCDIGAMSAVIHEHVAAWLRRQRPVIDERHLRTFEQAKHEGKALVARLLLTETPVDAWAGKCGFLLSAYKDLRRAYDTLRRCKLLEDEG